MDKFKIAICQMNVVKEKKTNIEKAYEMITAAARKGADIAVLPEMFNCPYENSFFRGYAESENGETIESISKLAEKNGIYIVAGSMPEVEDGKFYNTSFVFDRKGSIIGKHRKMHMFDIDVPGKIRFKESDILTPGNDITLIDTDLCRIGVAICYDIRFPELIRLMALQGAKLIVVPAAFNMVTGPAHWEALFRVRAIDNQVYIAAASPARNEKSSYVAYGNSMLVEPWGDIAARAGAGEELLIHEIDLGQIDKVRNELPLLKQRRTDIYDLRKNK